MAIDEQTLNNNSSPTEEKEIDWGEVSIGDDVAALISAGSLEKYGFIPFEVVGDEVKVAVLDRDDLNTQNALRFFEQTSHKKSVLIDIDEENFAVLLRRFKDPSVQIGEALSSYEETARAAEEEEKRRQKQLSGAKVEVLKDAPVAKMIEVIIKNAIDGGASDIHIEPLEKNVRVRYRVDGVLYNSLTLPKKLGPALVSRVKILSNLKIDERRKPQDGRFRISDLGENVDFRVSSFPTSYGEKVVMRILDTQTGLTTFDKLGIEGRDKILLEKIIEEPFGIILVTGPTGSGKSTTLYASLRVLNKVGVNIVTLEDPIEYVLEGINQSQVRPEIDYTFASGLRSILRQDPDIIMVGEIRDEETAELAIHASLTGHLVLSTLHTNSAIGAIARMLDMGVQPFLIASSLRLLMAQRLLRRICPDCREEVTELSTGAIDTIKEELRKMPVSALKRIKNFSGNSGEEVPIKVYYGKGCNLCQKTGSRGRIGIYEVVEVTPVIGRMIGSGALEQDIEKQAVEDGYTTMKQDGIIKALNGETTIEEVQRVTEDGSGEEAIDTNSP
ncbi:MAG TPA: type II/IV secretion system protein [Candidatus Moranbacteria bacterium]|nr:type II/IV secretion system protein [Candidatus Moranbacteria bacterium]